MDKADVSVSVIMPIYNAETFVSDSVNDILLQTLTNFELICVDDGSIDESGHILEKYAEKDDRIRVIHQDNQGGGVARNSGMVIARGKYLLFLDADDRFEENLLEKVVSAADENSCDVLVFNADTFDHITGKKNSASWLIKGDRETIVGNPFLQVNTTVWNKLFLRDYIERMDIRFPKTKIVDTMYFVAMALLGTSKISILREVLIHYRINNAKSVIANSDRYPCDIYVALRSIYAEIVDRDYPVEKLKYYYDFAMDNIRIRLNMLKSYSAFRELYMVLHDGGLDNLGLISDIERPERYNDWKLMVSIRENNVDEYLFKTLYCQKKIGINTMTSFRMPDAMLEIFKNKKIWIHGGGMVGRNYFVQLLNNGIHMVGWSDRSQASAGYPITSIDEMMKKEYDIVLLAVENEETVNVMQNDLIRAGIPKEKIYWERPIRI